MKKLISSFLLSACLLATSLSFSQTPGIIIRPAGSGGPAVLDPNTNGYTSLTTAGFGADDIATSEIPYKVVPPIISEPTGDLFRGPSGQFSDIVKKVDGSGFYLFNDGINFLCRLRIGGIVSGSKGYSILLDTDGKFGTADPNFQAATNGNNGNPGFELEVVLETNFRIAIYNVDGSSSPVLMSSYPIASNSQISVAKTSDGSDADYFYDFYVPFSALGITTSTPIRATATTVMAPAPAIGGPKSDIYGVSGTDYMNDWIAAIASQPPFTLTGISASGTGVGASCTNAPALDGPILPTTSSVTGTWTKSAYSTITTATITVYKGALAIGSTTVSTGGTWSVNVSGLSNNDVITAKAQGAGESMCSASNAVTVNACNSSNSPATPVLGCTSGSKGINGTNLSTGWTIHVDNITRNTIDNSVTNSGALFGANTGTSPAITWQYSGGCSSGSPLTSGSYKVYYTNNTTGCNSQAVYFCAAGNGPNALGGSVTLPAITSPAGGVLTTATNSIAGTTTPLSSLYLYTNSILTQTTTAAADGTFTFSPLTLMTGQQIYMTAELNTGTVGTSYCAAKTAVSTVTCYTNTPVIVTASSQLVAGAPIAGTSSEASGTIIKVYTSANTLVATTTVQSGGSWSTGNAGTTPSTYNAVAGTSYYANAQNGTCSVSSNSSTIATTTATSIARCGTLPATVTENATSVSGSLSGTALAGTIVTLYADGNAIGTYTTSNLLWGPIAVNTTVSNTIYSGAVLTIGITEPSKNEVTCAASVTVGCSVPSTPTVNPTISAVVIGQTITYTIDMPQSGILYSLNNNADASNIGSSQFGSGTSVTLVSYPFSATGTYIVDVKATSFSGANCQAARTATVYVTMPLPVTLENFTGKYNKGTAELLWNTLSEQNLASFELERSYTGANFQKTAVITAIGNNQVNQQYAYNDSGIASPVVYYRLKLMDKDKIHSKYSKVIVLHADKGLVLNSISPNPFTSQVKISIDVTKEVMLQVAISDISGRKISNIYYAAKAGLNTITLNDVASLPKGAYLIELNTGEQKISRQLLIKQ